MSLKSGQLYRTTEPLTLLTTEEQDAIKIKGGGFFWRQTFCTIDAGELLLVVKQSKFRYVKVVYQEFVGLIWLPTHLPSWLVLIPISEPINSKYVDYVKSKL